MVAASTSFAYERPSPQALDEMIQRYADRYHVPVALVRRVVRAESNFNPAARNGPYWGLMQIRVDTARGLGYRGTAAGLLKAETNLAYAVAYLANAYIVGGNEARGHQLYRTGYYYEAKRKRLLSKLITVRNPAEPEVMVASAAPVAPASKLAIAEEPAAPAPAPEVVAVRAPDPVPVPLPNPARIQLASAAAPVEKPVAAVKEVPVARPHVVLASVLPVPQMATAYTAEAEPAKSPFAPLPLAKPSPFEAATAAEPAADATIKPSLAAVSEDDASATDAGSDQQTGDVPLPRPVPRLAIALDEAVARYLASVPPLPRPRVAPILVSSRAD